MYILSTAAKNIRRHVGRYLLFGVLLFVALAVGTAMLAVSASLDAYLDEMVDKYGATVEVTDENRALSSVGLARVRTLESVKEARILGFSFAFWSESLTIDGKPIELEPLKGDTEVYRLLSEAGLTSLVNGEVQPKLFFHGEDLTTGAWVTDATPLREGRMPTAPGEVLLADDLAALLRLDGLGVGSTVELKIGRAVRSFSVVGTYSRKAWKAPKGLNGRYVPFLAATDDATAFDTGDTLVAYDQSMTAKYSPGAQVDLAAYNCYSAYLVLTGPEQIAPLRSHLLELGERIDRIFTMELYYPGGADLTDAYASTGQIVDFFLLAIIGLSAAVILIMTVLSMHERKYEIGVLLSVGMEKWRIALLFAIENLLFVLGVATLAYAVGLCTAPVVAKGLLEAVVTVSRRAAALPVAGQMLAFAVGLSLPASAISSAAIFAFKPMTILRSRT